MNRFFSCLLIVLSASVVFASEDQQGNAEAPIEMTPEMLTFFETKIRPVLVEYCFKCHGDGKHKGTLQLDGREHMLSGGDSGPAIVPGNPEESLLIQAINYDGYEMPPGQQLSSDKIADLTKWVQMGAPWPSTDSTSVAIVRKGGVITDEDREWWAYQPIAHPEIPTVAGAIQPVSPIDAFVLHKLAEKGIEPNGMANARTLVRRAFFDLIGLPPSPEEMTLWTERLTNGASDGGVLNQVAWAELIDDLLARPQYGERWGRHWLDVVRFAQTNGYERDNEKPYAWRFRDYVIDAFNSDKPYDRFLVEQLAGDELPDADRNTRIATGFYRLGIWDDEPDDLEQAEFDDLDDIIGTSSAAFLGLTMSCARCHDHKFDPISHKDYYSYLAFFRGVKRYNIGAEDFGNPGLVPISTDEQIQQAIEDQKSRLAALDEKIKATEDKEAQEKLKKEREAIRVQGLEWSIGVRERSKEIPDTNILIRGSAQTPGDLVTPAFPAILGGEEAEVTSPGQIDPLVTSGRRLALAQWFIKDDHPLTARVMANRVWHYHFGRGIVPTTSDFGRTGEPASNLELLDWLANSLKSNHWSVKNLHRTIMTSLAYQRSSENHNVHANEVDPANTLVWRQNLRRLDAEAIRDTILAVAGNINYEMHGRGFFPRVGAEVLSGGSVPGGGWEVSSLQQEQRRSIYTFVKRSLVSPQLDIFDYANTALPLTERPTTTVAPQALTLLNDDFMTTQAAGLAKRVTQSAGPSLEEKIQAAFETALNRSATEAELRVAKQFVQNQSAEYASLRTQMVFRPLVPVALTPSYLRQLKSADFIQTPGSDWESIKGIWRGDTLDVNQGPVSLWKGAVFQDAQITATVTLGNASELASIFLRSNASGDFVKGYEVLLDALHSRIAIVRHDGNPVTLAELSTEIPTGEIMSLDCRIQGETISLRLTSPGKELELAAVDSAPLAAAGQLGVRTWGGAVTFDNFLLNTDQLIVDVASAEVAKDDATRAVVAKAWAEFGGNWTTDSNGVLRPMQSGPGAKLVSKEKSIGDGEIEVDVRLKGRGDGGLLVRTNNPQDGVDSLTAYNINFSASELRLGKHENNWKALVTVPQKFSSEEWTKLRIKLDGPRIIIYVNGSESPSIDYVDSNPLPAGSIGFRIFNCQAEFQNLSLKEGGGFQQVDLASVSPSTNSRADLFVVGVKLDESEKKAFETLCLLVLNLNEMIYVD
ncbi:DUF1553 domain-containing protein [Planctomicrobium sp. SH668]|uniref:DUF1553 domain-containing protein n=1 Tax=Planctomicrobium sp. SH668 TaxID=3448126 RepID=UPI003F5CA6C1